MITLGVVDIILLIVLLILIYFSTRRRSLPFYVAIAVIGLITLERLVPGTMAGLGNGIRSLDAINSALPHVQIQPIIRIAP
jgi:hypothetical protein